MKGQTHKLQKEGTMDDQQTADFALVTTELFICASLLGFFASERDAQKSGKQLSDTSDAGRLVRRSTR